MHAYIHTYIHTYILKAAASGITVENFAGKVQEALGVSPDKVSLFVCMYVCTVYMYGILMNKCICWFCTERFGRR